MRLKSDIECIYLRGSEFYIIYFSYTHAQYADTAAHASVPF